MPDAFPKYVVYFLLYVIVKKLILYHIVKVQSNCKKFGRRALLFLFTFAKLDLSHKAQ